MLSKKENLLIAALAIFSFQSHAQLTIQSGATFTLMPGAQVTVQGNVENAGSLNNKGTLKIQGNYINSGSYTAANGVLEIYGAGNSNISSGASAIANLTINKSADKYCKTPGPGYRNK